MPLPREIWWLFAPLLPMLGIRFLAVAWRDHYGAVVTAAAVMGLAAVMRTRVVPGVVVAGTLLVLLLNDEVLLRRDAKSWTGAQGWGQSAGCQDVPGRSAAVRAAVEYVRGSPGPLFVSGNLLPWLAERDDVSAFGGPQPATLEPNIVVMEKPPCGDTWARPLAERQALYETWKNRKIYENEFVLVAAH